MKLLGKSFLPDIYKQLDLKIDQLKLNGVTPTLCIVKSVEAPDINTYVNAKVKAGAEHGINVKVVVYPAATLADKVALAAEIQKLNTDPTVHGIIFQKPSHPNVDDELEKLINPVKDVDGFLEDSPHKPPVYRGVLRSLDEIYQKDFPDILPSKTFVVIGKGKTGGAPVIVGLKKDGINTVHVIDTKTSPEDTAKFLKYASVVVSAVGKRNPVDPNLLPEQGILIDFGIHFEGGKIAPDFAETDIQERMQYYTTTPGGIGTLTVAYLLDNTADAAAKLSF